MKIASLETTIVRLPFDKPIRTPVHYIETLENVLVTLRTDEGLEGISYLWAFGLSRARVLEAMVRDLYSVVEGSDPRQRLALWDAMRRDLNFLGRGGVGYFALSALDTAMTDIAARAAGEPMWRFLGGAERELEAYAGGMFLSDQIETIVEEAQGYVKQGYRSIKMRVGAADAQEDVARVAAVREAIGPHTRLLLDVVQGWSMTDAIKRARSLEPYDIFYIEDPLLYDELDAMAALASAIDTPIAAGENNYGKEEFLRLIQSGAVDIPMIDLQRVGGISEWLRAASLCEAHALPVVPHVFHEISVHLAMAAPNVLFLEHVPWWDRLFDKPPQLQDGKLRPGSEPGLGLRFAQDAIETYRAER